MWAMRLSFIVFLISVVLFTVGSAQSGPLHTSGRWIVNANNERVKLRCVNWAGHLETNIPEGLSHQPLDNIADWISINGFNCVRLTYSIDMALNPDLPVAASFTSAAIAANVWSQDMQAQFDSAAFQNPFLSSATTLSTFSEVILALAARAIMVVLDNHVSHSGWCCLEGDGNGWWTSAEGYDEGNSRYFITEDWLNGLRAMAEFSLEHPNVVGMSLRNELRAVGSQDGNDHADWYDLVTQGANTIYAANSDLLIVIGGVESATDLSFLQDGPLDTSGWPDRTVWEFHSYSWSDGRTVIICPTYKDFLGEKAGFLLTADQPYTGPLWLSEFGIQQIDTASAEQEYLTCLVEYMEDNDADWAAWALQGSYYVRDGIVDYDESFGLLNYDWTDWRSETFKDSLGSMFEMTQVA